MGGKDAPWLFTNQSDCVIEVKINKWSIHHESNLKLKTYLLIVIKLAQKKLHPISLFSLFTKIHMLFWPQESNYFGFSSPSFFIQKIFIICYESLSIITSQYVFQSRICIKIQKWNIQNRMKSVRKNYINLVFPF